RLIEGDETNFAVDGEFQRVGYAKLSSDDGHRAAVFVFALPTLAADETLTSANLSFSYLQTDASPDFGLDLYGIGFFNSTNPVFDLYEGDYASYSGDNVGIQNNVISPTSSLGVISTDDTGDSNLAAYLQSFYIANPDYTGGSYVFLRINPDGPANKRGTNGYRV